LKYANLRENITKAIEIIPKEYYKNIIEGAYNRKIYCKEQNPQKSKENVSIMGVLNVQRFKYFLCICFDSINYKYIHYIYNSSFKDITTLFVNYGTGNKSNVYSRPSS
jgi:hypothetical protein